MVKGARGSIAGLMAMVAFSGVGFAALHASTGWWAKAMLSLSIATYSVALLGGLFARRPGRTGWAGFFVFGAGYLALCLGPWSEDRIMPRLLTTAIIDDHYQQMDHVPRYVGERVWVEDRPGSGHEPGWVFGELDDTPAGFNVSVDRGGTSRFPSSQIRVISREDYRLLCHCVVGFPCAFAGAMLALFFSGAREGRGDVGEGRRS